MGLLTWVAIAVIVLVAIGLGVGVFFSGLIRGAEIIGQNPTVQNASKETQEFVQGRTGISSNVLVITTNEFTYNKGEPVVITVKNNGDGTLTFPDSAFGLEIKNVDAGKNYRVVAAQVMTELKPGQSGKITWDSGDADPGEHAATVHTIPANSGISAQVNFKITG